MTNTYKDLIVWQKSMDLVKDIYQLTSELPQSEKIGLVSHLRRAAVSIPSNIAEGYGRNYAKERRQFLAQATGSAREIETQLLIVKSLGFSKAGILDKSQDLTEEVLRMLAGLSKSISASHNS